MECSKVDLPQPFSPARRISGCERFTIIGMWKLRFVNTGCARIFRYMKSQDSRGRLVFYEVGATSLNRIVLAFRCFFNLLFSGELSSETLAALNLTRRGAAPASAPKTAAAAAPAPTVRTSDGALQLLAILQ